MTCWLTEHCLKNTGILITTFKERIPVISKGGWISGEETTKEDYDWDSITKAVKSFVDNYNKTIESAGSSNTKDVLRNAAARAGGTYTSTGNYSDVLSSILPSNIDKKE